MVDIHKMKVGVTLKLSALIVIVIIFFSFVAYAIVKNFILEQLVYERHEHTVFSISLIQLSLEKLQAEQMKVGAQGLVAQLSTARAVKRAFFLNPVGEVIASTKRIDIGEKIENLLSIDQLQLLREHEKRVRKSVTIDVWQIGDDQQRFYLAPFSSGVNYLQPMQDDTIGFIYIELDFSSLDFETQQRLFQILPNLFILLFGLGVVFFISAYMIYGRRIKALLDYSLQAPSKNDLNQRVILEGNDEIAAIAVSTNKLLEKVKSKSDHIDDQEQQQHRILDSMSDTVVIIDSNGFIRYINDAGQRLFGYSSAKLVRNKIDVLMPTKDAEKHQSYVDASAIGSGSVIIGNGRELEAVKKDGSIFPIRLVVTKILSNSSEVQFVGCIQDLTEVRELEKKKIVSYKMETIGQLAGGIAHDFNNLLTVIMGNAELAVSISEDLSEPRLTKFINNILHSTERGSSLTSQLLAYGKFNSAAEEVVDINARIDDLKSTFSQLCREDITVTYKLNKVSNIKFYAVHFDQIIMNFVINARDSIATNGEIKIETGVASQAAVSLLGNGDVSIEMNYIAVTDNGCGISDKLKQKIFDPFFTTKREGEGSGLGLSTVQKIVQDGGGYLDVTSDVDKGSTFTAYLPASVSVALSILKPTISKVSDLTGINILLCEDDENIRDLTRIILESFGASVLIADTPQDAVELARNNEDIDVLLTDVVMPELNGKELYNKIYELRPIKVIYMSGYPGNIIAKHGVLQEGENFLPKPYTQANLLNAVRDVLSSS